MYDRDIIEKIKFSSFYKETSRYGSTFFFFFFFIRVMDSPSEDIDSFLFFKLVELLPECKSHAWLMTFQEKLFVFPDEHRYTCARISLAIAHAAIRHIRKYSCTFVESFELLFIMRIELRKLSRFPSVRCTKENLAYETAIFVP